MKSVAAVSSAFTILPGLPPYGPLPLQFSVDGRGTHREGLAIEFKHGAGDWVGNFQRGGTGFDAAIGHPDRESVIVIAGGQGYIVDRSNKTAPVIFGGEVTGVVASAPDQVILSTFTDFLAFGPVGQQWQTRRLSWDGFRSLHVQCGVLRGEAWSPAGSQWIEFSVQLETGEASGGAYP